MQAVSFSIFDADGRILRYGSVPAHDVERQAKAGESILEGHPPTDDCYVEDDQFVPMPARPSIHHVFDYATKQWVDPRTLEDLKAQRWLAVRGARDAAEFGGFTWDGSTFDSDAMSQSRIMGAAQLAQLDPAFTVDWTLADNSVRTLSADDMVAVGVALGQHVATQHATARTLRAQIQAAATAAEVAAVVWPS